MAPPAVRGVRVLLTGAGVEPGDRAWPVLARGPHWRSHPGGKIVGKEDER
jgi:hypothetical protein